MRGINGGFGGFRSGGRGESIIITNAAFRRHGYDGQLLKMWNFLEDYFFLHEQTTVEKQTDLLITQDDILSPFHLDSQHASKDARMKYDVERALLLSFSTIFDVTKLQVIVGHESVGQSRATSLLNCSNGQCGRKATSRLLR